LSFSHAILLFFAGALAGAMNAVAGGGSFVAFPTLLFTGVPPIPANATNTLSLWVGTAVSGGAYRRHLNLPRRVLLPLVSMGLLGGLAGALLLIKTPAHTFLRLIPWLMLAATLLFTFGRHLTGRLSAGISHQASNAALAGASFFELLVAIYGGYFGGGIGMMNLAMFAALGMTDSIVWPQALVMIVGAGLGGYASAHYAQKLPQSLVRAMIITLGVGMTIYFFLKAYR
jgi:uncharacterized protein